MAGDDKVPLNPTPGHGGMIGMVLDMIDAVRGVDVLGNAKKAHNQQQGKQPDGKAAPAPVDTTPTPAPGGPGPAPEEPETPPPPKKPKK